MEVQISEQITALIKGAKPDDKLDVCQNCGNTYLIIWLKNGEDYNDFGFRYCPFCGLCTDQLTGDVVI